MLTRKTRALAELVLRVHPDHFGKAGAQDADQRKGVRCPLDKAHDLSRRLPAERDPAGRV